MTITAVLLLIGVLLTGALVWSAAVGLAGRDSLNRRPPRLPERRPEAPRYHPRHDSEGRTRRLYSGPLRWPGNPSDQDQQ